ncbi:hypothetical protein BOX15_Mlig000301g1, partial [Macrostomum lignano]
LLLSKTMHTTDQQQTQEPSSQSSLTAHQNRTESLASTLDAWRRVLVRLDAALHWEQPATLGALLAGITLLFVLIAWLQPPLITMAALACLLAAACDYLVPCASQLLLPNDWSQVKGLGHDWVQADEQRYTDLCSRLVRYWDVVARGAETLVKWRRDRPQVYLAVTVLTLLGLMLIGERINNLFLAYLAVVALLLAPGLRRSGLPQRAMAQLIGKLRSGRKTE